MIRAPIVTLSLGTLVRNIGETGKAADLYHPAWLGFIFVFLQVDLYALA